jgi:hypothetical protein
LDIFDDVDEDDTYSPNQEQYEEESSPLGVEENSDPVQTEVYNNTPNFSNQIVYSMPKGNSKLPISQKAYA